MLLIVVVQDEKAALVVIEGIDAHQFSRTSSRGNQWHPNLVRASRFAPQPGQDHGPGRMKPATTIDPATSPAGTADRHHPGDLFQVLAARIG